MAVSVAGVAQFKGEFKILDGNGKKTILSLPFDQTVSLEQLAHVVQTIPAGTVDAAIGFAGVARAKALYINPNGVEIDVKFEVNTNTAHKISGPSVIIGEITALFVTTGADAACVEVVVGGPST